MGKSPGKSVTGLRHTFPIPHHELVTELSAYIPDFSYQLYNLSRYSDAQIKGEVLLQVCMRMLKHSGSPDLLERLPGIFALLEDLTQQDTGVQYFESLLKYIFNLNSLSSVNINDIRAVIVDTLSGGKQGELVMTLAERLREEGKIVGMEEGEIVGMKKGVYKTAANLKMLGLPPDIIHQATGLSMEEIDQLPEGLD